ncbi:MAG: citrate lyase holo-[acyl-carrier protein] synthase [Eubacteriales bacterium]|nr:citrate lyase holo-[acyl-carrier protein] synthase [Eubacteriales bacterium]
MENREVTLYEVLDFREKKAGIQAEMRAQCPGGIVVSLGMNIPGPVKSGPLFYEAFLEGKRSLEGMLKTQQGKVMQMAVLEENAGYAAIYFLSGADGGMLKKEAVFLEESHALGRLFDIDVEGQDGRLMSRVQAGTGKRTCLICGKEAKACGRNRTHSVKELQDKVLEIIGAWKREE